MAPSIKVREIGYGSADYEEAVRLRDRVLRRPLGLSFSPDELAKEGGSRHFAAFEAGRLVGCLILVPLAPSELKMRQVAVSPEAQGRGVGTLLIAAAEEFGAQNGFEWMKLSARETAVPFYLGLGYELVGEAYIEVTIPHRAMQKRLGQ